MIASTVHVSNYNTGIPACTSPIMNREVQSITVTANSAEIHIAKWMATIGWSHVLPRSWLTLHDSTSLKVGIPVLELNVSKMPPMVLFSRQSSH